MNINLNINDTDYPITNARINPISLQEGIAELKAINGVRTYEQGNYLNIQFIVNLFKNSNPISEFNRLKNLEFSTCYLTLSNTSFVFNMPFIIYNVSGFFLTDTSKYDIATINLMSSNLSVALSYLIDDDGDFIITDKDEKIIVDI